MFGLGGDASGFWRLSTRYRKLLRKLKALREIAGKYVATTAA
jgi:hypothetical protein